MVLLEQSVDDLRETAEMPMEQLLAETRRLAVQGMLGGEPITGNG